jgi:hypothetical protein
VVEVDEIGVGGVLVVSLVVQPHQDRVLIAAKREVVTLQFLLEYILSSFRTYMINGLVETHTVLHSVHQCQSWAGRLLVG